MPVRSEMSNSFIIDVDDSSYSITNKRDGERYG